MNAVVVFLCYSMFDCCRFNIMIILSLSIENFQLLFSSIVPEDKLYITLINFQKITNLTKI